MTKTVALSLTVEEARAVAWALRHAADGLGSAEGMTAAAAGRILPKAAERPALNTVNRLADLLERVMNGGRVAG
jgi:hypothetical protein